MKSTTIRFADAVYTELERASELTGLPINSIVTFACLEWLRANGFTGVTEAAGRGDWPVLPRRPLERTMSLAPRPMLGDSPVADLTVTARAALDGAGELALRAGRPAVAAAHLLAALDAAPEGRATRVLARLGADVEALLAAAAPPAGAPGGPVGEEDPSGAAGRGAPVPGPEPGPEARRAIRRARLEAGREHAERVGTGHLLLGLLLDGDAVLAAALHAAGVTERRVREALRGLGPEP